MKLTEQQVENWRNVLYFSIGPYARFMPRWQIEVIVSNLQGYIDREESARERQEAELARVVRERAIRQSKEKARDDRLASIAARVAEALDE